MGIMPKPTKTALSKTPSAVIMLAATAKEPGVVYDYDYEGFEPEDDRDMFFTEVVGLAEKDVSEKGDLVHVIVDVSATAPLTIGKVVVRGRDLPKGWSDKRIAEITANPSLVVAPSPVRATKAAAKPAPVKGRKQSAAAAVVNGKAKTDDTPTEAPKPRAAQVKARRKAADPKGEAAQAAQAAAENAETEATAEVVTEQAAPIATTGAAARKAALKKRLKANTEDAGMGLVTQTVERAATAPTDMKAFEHRPAVLPGRAIVLRTPLKTKAGNVLVDAGEHPIVDATWFCDFTGKVSISIAVKGAEYADNGGVIFTPRKADRYVR